MEFIESLARKYGGVVIAGVVGAIIRRIRETMTLLEFLQVIFLGVFVSYCVGVAVEEYFEISEHFKYVIGAVSAIYSKEVLDEIKDVISGISESIRISIMIFDAFLFALNCAFWGGFMQIEPNEARVMIFFGKYEGTVKENGFFWVNPFYTKKKFLIQNH